VIAGSELLTLSHARVPFYDLTFMAIDKSEKSHKSRLGCVHSSDDSASRARFCLLKSLFGAPAYMQRASWREKQMSHLCK
jgi:hypothetical protein